MNPLALVRTPSWAVYALLTHLFILPFGTGRSMGTWETLGKINCSDPDIPLPCVPGHLVFTHHTLQAQCEGDEHRDHVYAIQHYLYYTDLNLIYAKH